MANDIGRKTVFTVGEDVGVFEVHVLRDRPNTDWKGAYRMAWKKLLKECQDVREVQGYDNMPDEDKVCFLEAVLDDIESKVNSMGEVFVALSSEHVAG